MSKKVSSGIAGVLPVIKPIGPTSHDVVQIVRRALKERGIGHTGTLDPAADGLLLLCIGGYTKLVPYLTASSKTYTGTITIGVDTSTDDREGCPLSFKSPEALTLESVQKQLRKLVGDIDQIPPNYAAVKIAGKKLYEYARENVEVAIEPRKVTVYNFEVSNLRDGEVPPELIEKASDLFPANKSYPTKIVDFKVKVSSGTYVRALARDLGKLLGSAAYLSSLNRTKVGKFDVVNAVSLEELRSNPEVAEKYLCRGTVALDSERYPIFTVIKAFEDRIMRGQPIHNRMLEECDEAGNLKSGTVIGIASEEGDLLGMMEAERLDQNPAAELLRSKAPLFTVGFKSLRNFPGGLG